GVVSGEVEHSTLAPQIDVEPVRSGVPAPDVDDSAHPGREQARATDHRAKIEVGDLPGHLHRGWTGAPAAYAARKAEAPPADRVSALLKEINLEAERLRRPVGGEVAGHRPLEGDRSREDRFRVEGRHLAGEIEAQR